MRCYCERHWTDDMMQRRDSFNGSVSFVVSSVYVDAKFAACLFARTFFFFFGPNFVVYGSYRSGISPIFLQRPSPFLSSPCLIFSLIGYLLDRDNTCHLSFRLSRNSFQNLQMDSPVGNRLPLYSFREIDSSIYSHFTTISLCCFRRIHLTAPCKRRHFFCQCKCYMA